jgi:DNA-binding MarR family transcriptional regulator
MRQSTTMDLDLEQFLPYRLNRLADAVSRQLAEVYQERYGIDVPRWRVIATLGPDRSYTAQYIAGSTRMHKTRVSRAVAELSAQGLLRGTASAADRRETLLSLTSKGRRLYHQLVPLALAREQELFSCLGAAHLQAFLGALERLEQGLGVNPGQ